jgi:hypothetical protein
MFKLSAIFLRLSARFLILSADRSAESVIAESVEVSVEREEEREDRESAMSSRSGDCETRGERSLAALFTPSSNLASRTSFLEVLSRNSDEGEQAQSKNRAKSKPTM